MRLVLCKWGTLVHMVHKLSYADISAIKRHYKSCNLNLKSQTVWHLLTLPSSPSLPHPPFLTLTSSPSPSSPSPSSPSLPHPPLPHPPLPHPPLPHPPHGVPAHQSGENPTEMMVGCQPGGLRGNTLSSKVWALSWPSKLSCSQLLSIVNTS